ncbi:hypothetical protein K1T71_013262 [Dendrolimus kikuchii]|uniref:Uncharacterized protein n=1 Tax=Dendrolimus kikuchii TaxID=765133 RepID=A0ACC1CHJ8_9NEOP|nr:hypothetical protein K1T71_013262 [Dendrolimus kikuchii]
MTVSNVNHGGTSKDVRPGIFPKQLSAPLYLIAAFRRERISTCDEEIGINKTKVVMRRPVVRSVIN